MNMYKKIVLFIICCGNSMYIFPMLPKRQKNNTNSPTNQQTTQNLGTQNNTLRNPRFAQQHERKGSI